MELGKHESALQAFEKILAEKPGSREAWYRKGLALLKLENFEDALKAFDEVIAKDEDYEDAGILKGFAQIKLGECASALETFEKYLRKNPTPIRPVLQRTDALQSEKV
jgi:tetratricopeptide (TPR) repeat protein